MFLLKFDGSNLYPFYMTSKIILWTTDKSGQLHNKSVISFKMSLNSQIKLMGDLIVIAVNKQVFLA